MPCFFVFAVVFTVIMLEGRMRAFFTMAEIALYAACFLVAYIYPETVAPFPKQSDIIKDIVAGCLGAAIVLAIAIYQHIAVYDRKQYELEKANEQLRDVNRMKTEFLQDIKHEIRKPLHVISYCGDAIHHLMDTGDNIEEAHNILLSMQNEAVRLGRMTNAMVELATMEDAPTVRTKVDIALILSHCADTYRHGMRQKQNTFHVNIAPGLPFVYAQAEQLERVPDNLIHNSLESTQNGEITLEAAADDRYITVRIIDTGEGIHPELIAQVFERGVSGTGGKGYGLYMCKTIVEAHGGEIELKSEHGMGTTVIFTIPVYGGQDEVRLHG